MKTATILIIGDELLHGEIQDENGPWLIKRLTELGVDVNQLHILPDETETIAEYLERSLHCDFVFTTGGIGPTHDDRTREAVAKALDRELIQNEDILSLLEDHHDSELTEAQKRLATLPEGSDIIHVQETAGIAFQAGNIFVFPGIPELLRPLFNQLASRFDGVQKISRSFTIRALESDIADQLSKLQNRYPDLQFGSYPHENGTLTLKIRGRKEEQVKEAFEDLRKTIDYPRAEM